MALTKDFRTTVKARAERDPKFRRGLLEESYGCLVEGDIATFKSLMRNYINATSGFEALAKATGTPSKSLHRMFSAGGNPRADNLFRILASLSKAERVAPQVKLISKKSLHA